MSENLKSLPWIMGAIIVTSCFHEAGHAWAAWRLGDRRPHIADRRRFWSPRHISLWFTLVIPAVLFVLTGFMFGGARPVMVSTKAISPWRMVLVALAGPAGNMFVGVLSLFLVVGLLHAGVIYDGGGAITPDTRYGYLMYAVGVSFFLGFLNLLPIPPLDGSRVLAAFMPERLRGLYYRLSLPGAIGLFLVFVVVGSYWPEKLSFLNTFFGRTVPGWTRSVLEWVQT